MSSAITFAVCAVLLSIALTVNIMWAYTAIVKGEAADERAIVIGHVVFFFVSLIVTQLTVGLVP